MRLPLVRSLVVSCFLLIGGFCDTIRCFRLAEFVYRGGKKFGELLQSPNTVSLFWFTIAMTYYSRGGEPAALNMLQKRIRTDTQDPMAYYGLAEFYEFTEQRESALVNYYKALTLETNEVWRAKIQSRLDRVHATKSPPACDL